MISFRFNAESIVLSCTFRLASHKHDIGFSQTAGILGNLSELFQKVRKGCIEGIGN